MSEYKERDHMHLDQEGNYYSKHVLAMTQEGLHNKSDIAAELAYRDFEIDVLKDDVHRARNDCPNCEIAGLRMVKEEFELMLHKCLRDTKIMERTAPTFPERMQAKMKAEQIQAKIDWVEKVTTHTTNNEEE